jgi:hypothetical protein
MHALPDTLRGGSSEFVDARIQAPAVVASDHQATTLASGLLVVGDDRVDREPVGIPHRPVGVEEDDDEIIKRFARKCGSCREVVRLTTLDVASGDSHTTSSAVSQVKRRPGSYVFRRKALNGPCASSTVRFGCHRLAYRMVAR